MPAPRPQQTPKCNGESFRPPRPLSRTCLGLKPVTSPSRSCSSRRIWCLRARRLVRRRPYGATARTAKRKLPLTITPPAARLRRFHRQPRHSACSLPSCICASRRHFCPDPGQSHERRGTAGTGLTHETGIDPRFVRLLGCAARQRAMRRTAAKSIRARSVRACRTCSCSVSMQRAAIRSGWPVCRSARCSDASCATPPSPALWSPAANRAMAELVQCIIDDCIGAVTGITGRNEDGATASISKCCCCR